jgi:hypothetical protein
VNGLFDVLVRLVDMLESALLEALGEGVVFFLGNIVVSLVDEFECTVETSAPVEACVNCRMIVQILAVVDGGLLDFVDGFIDFVDSFLFLFTQLAGIGTLEMGASVTEIRQSMKIRGMLFRRLRLRTNGRRNEEQEREECVHQFAKAFHRTSGSYSNEFDLLKPPPAEAISQT